jgi:hypothetical protein
MIHIKWVILAAIILAWLWIAREDMKSSGYGTGLMAMGATLLAIIAALVWYIIFF